MKIRIAAPKTPHIPGTRRTRLVVLSLRRPTEVFEQSMKVSELRRALDRWLLRLTPEERAETRFRVYAEVEATGGGARRVRLGEWKPGESLEAFLSSIRTRFAEVPVDPSKSLPLVRDAWVEEEKLFGTMARRPQSRPKAASRRTMR